MLILKYFLTVGAVLTTALFAVNAYLEPPTGSAAAGGHMSFAASTATLPIVPAKPQPVALSEAPAPAPRAAAPSAHSTHQRHRVR
jgi:hypothetical protein